MCSHGGDSRIGEQILQQGFGRLVVLESGGDTVRKTFSMASPAESEQMAQAEFERLRGFYAALASVPGAICPQPLTLVPEPTPGFRMERVAGLPLLLVLRRRSLSPPEVDELANVIAAALVAYVEAVGEPYYDFQFDNVLWDEASGTLAFLDLGLPQAATRPNPASSPYEVTLGNMLGSVVFQSARPKYVLRRRQHRGTVALASRTVEALRVTGAAEVRAPRVAAAADAAYARCAYRRSPSRTAWYATAGYLTARRVRLPGFTARPVVAWRR